MSTRLDSLIVDGPEPRVSAAYVGRRVRDLQRHLLGATVVVAGCAIIAKSFVVGRDLAVAYRFGRDGAVDAFLLANLLPTAILSGIVGPVAFAVLPMLATRAQSGGSGSWNHLAQSIFMGVLGLAAIGGLLIAVTVPIALSLMAEGTTLAMSNAFLWWLLPSFLLQVVAGYLAVLIRAHERHVVVSLIPAVTPGVTALTVLWGGFGPMGLGVGMLVGAAIETSLMLAASRRLGIRFRADQWLPVDHDLRIAIRQYASVAFAAILMSATLMVDQGVAAVLGDPGSLAAISYGTRVTGTMLALIVTPMATAALPHFSRAAAAKDVPGMRRVFLRYSAGLLVCSVLGVGVLAYFSEELTRVLFQRGAFTARDTALVADLQGVYLLMVPFVMVEQLGVRVLAAVGEAELFTRIAGMNFVLNLGLDVLFMSLMGLQGIAVATVAVSAFSAGVITWTVFRVARA